MCAVARWLTRRAPRATCAPTQVSNDQMRDHVWSMLRPKHMLKWKERHVVRYEFNFAKTVFTPREPLPYTPCVQQCASGVWLLPSADAAKGWLLVRPHHQH
jgi:proteinaceous RNase P